jgi:hypothetical protein
VIGGSRSTKGSRYLRAQLLRRLHFRRHVLVVAVLTSSTLGGRSGVANLVSLSGCCSMSFILMSARYSCAARD